MGDLTMDFLRLMLMAAMLLTSLQGQAADTANAPAALSATHEVEFLRNPDAACTDCHVKAGKGPRLVDCRVCHNERTASEFAGKKK